MKDLTKFNHSVNVLLKAYLNDTLQFGNYCACAVGNLLADANSIKLSVDPKSTFGEIVWDKNEGGFIGSEWYSEYNTTPKLKHLINPSGYSLMDIRKIERAFEKQRKTYRINNDDTDMFNGLMAVVDVLAGIHKIDMETVKETKELFV